MDKYLIKPDKKIKLSEWNTRETSLWEKNKEDAKSELIKINEEVEKLQELLFAEKKHKLLIVLQAMDTGGKDGVIRSVFEGVNPSGVRVASFKVPTQIELEHDYLWRIHQQTPAKGEIVIFNRSHYEDVLVVRVHNLVEKEIWSARYDQINAFEKILFEEGTTIIKFFLHISKDEQKERLQERIDIPEKRWKFSNGDLKERTLWDDYQKAYEDVLQKTSTNYAPWYLIPSDRNWYRDYLIGTILLEKLKSLKMKYPTPEEGIEKIKVI